MAYTDAGHLLARPPVAPPNAPAVAYIGALERTKGIDVLVEAWREVRRRMPDATLEVVGDGALRGIVARDAHALGIRFHGEVPHEHVTEVLDGVRFLVVPSRSEGLGRVVWEASARGRPVVASAVGGIPEQVREGETGLLVTPEDPSALADAIVRMLADPLRCAAMGVEAHRAAENRDPVGEFEGGVARLAAWVGRR
jgi:glycosyltransferase involved in cell wall biosynthesis